MPLPSLKTIHQTVKNALKEDLGQLDVAGDITACLIATNKRGTAQLFAEGKGILCGRAWFDASFLLLDRELELTWHREEGERIYENQLLCEVYGRVPSILAGERTALNFLQTLSGTATQAAAFAQLQTGETLIFDTRKTIPGLRLAQKYAVRVGGCQNHRLGTYDVFLIKENHLKFCDSMADLVARARNKAPDKPIIMEVETIKELQEALRLDIDVILLDNFTLQRITEAVQLRKNAKKNIALEISGGMTAERVHELSALEIERISVGNLTKDCQALNFSLRFQ